MSSYHECDSRDFCDEKSQELAEALERINSLEAENDRLRRNQRTNGTHEICAYGPERCRNMYDFQWCECENDACPLRAAKVLEG